ncbi:hypothetical protein K504DRAFT_491409 [Pleomassaria siparia CBS 279.74]|uniref:Small nuclear ribonucleoprotein Prp3 C-terminal domain-containing protein n=1 Tax=Pleomassaria siparia CBS 279.74 TaxID=1314801 RepID=A0A6G1K7I9_9PLEO|nr:hypothetical protein K504DRAFT_491409 [Pleomassaria siparia CBS 279.74]
MVPEDVRQLPLPLLEQQLSAIDLLLCMFPDEIELASSTAASIEELRRYLEDPSPEKPRLPPSAECTLNVSIDAEHHLELHVQIPLQRGNVDANEDEDEPPLPIVMFRCPTWMNRKAHADMVQQMPVDSQDAILMVIEYLKQEVADYLTSQTASISEVREVDTKLVRVWFYLQSLSTRSKRDDMVNWAPNYGLTGFVLAGKPGILCLEGRSDNISSYMSEIKTRSWSDVPSHQKKVSERYREEGIAKRVFENMREVTGEISQGGHRGNRGEMREVREMFEGVGLSDVFAEVLGLAAVS